LITSIFAESILAVRNVGVQVKTTYLSGRSVSHFIERSRICDIIIHEAITMWQVKFYMAIITAKQDKMTVVFEVRLNQAVLGLSGIPMFPLTAVLTSPFILAPSTALKPYLDYRLPWSKVHDFLRYQPIEPKSPYLETYFFF
jgi:GPI-GlcNAc transferase complex, PIG-H component